MAKQQLLETLNKVFKRKSREILEAQLSEYMLKNEVLFADTAARNGFKSVAACVAALMRSKQRNEHFFDDIILFAAACYFDSRIQVAMPKGRVFIEEPPSDKRPRRTVHLRWEPFDYSIAPMYDLRASI